MLLLLFLCYYFITEWSTVMVMQKLTTGQSAGNTSLQSAQPQVGHLCHTPFPGAKTLGLGGLLQDSIFWLGQASPTCARLLAVLAL